MTNLEILNYFAGNTVYQFNGSVSAFQLWQAQLVQGYNYIVVNGSIYFALQGNVDETEVNDSRVTVVTEEQ